MALAGETARHQFKQRFKQISYLARENFPRIQALNLGGLNGQGGLKLCKVLLGNLLHPREHEEKGNDRLRQDPIMRSSTEPLISARCGPAASDFELSNNTAY